MTVTNTRNEKYDIRKQIKQLNASHYAKFEGVPKSILNQPNMPLQKSKLTKSISLPNGGPHGFRSFSHGGSKVTAKREKD